MCQMVKQAVWSLRFGFGGEASFGTKKGMRFCEPFF